MRGLSKVAILSVAIIAIGGQLFAPPPGAAAYQQSNRDEFVRRSAIIAHEWKTDEIDEFNRTNIVPTEIGDKFTYAQLVECLKGLEQTLGSYHEGLLSRLQARETVE